MLTLGTGRKPGAKEKTGNFLSKMVPQQIHKIENMLSHGFSNDGNVRHHMKTAMANHEGFIWYKWHGGLEVGAMALDKSKYKHFDRMDDRVGRYMRRAEIAEQVLEIAVRLVAERRRRFKLTSDKWTRFAGATLIECPLRYCKAKPSGTRKEAEKHVQDKHPNGEWSGSWNDVELRHPSLRGPWHRVDVEFRLSPAYTGEVDL